MQLDNPDVFFLIIGSGTGYRKLINFFDRNNPRNMKLISSLPKRDYDMVTAVCDVGMIFLDYRFTTPNFPSRLLGYMQAKLPVFVCTDIGEVIVNGGFG